MKAPTQIPPPANWQDFETLCKKLWGEIWNCSDTIKKNGRLGQEQCGVDVYGAPNGIDYYGIQCKGKDNYTRAQLTKKEIDEEIRKAQNFMPQLKSLYFATTSVKDASIEEYIRLKNIESQSSGGFRIDIFFWEDIVDKLIESRNTYHWYVNDCQFTDSPDINVQVVGDNFKLTPVILMKTSKYSLHPYKKGTVLRQYFDLQQKKAELINLSSIQETKNKNYSYCKTIFEIKNTGSTVLSDYHLKIRFINGVKDYDIGECYCNHPLINPTEKEYINNRIDNERKLFLSDSQENTIEFRPKIKNLVQEDSQTLTVYILPELNTELVTIEWTFLSNGYKKTGNINLDVSFNIETETETIYVDSVEELKPEESTLEYKIIED